MSVIFDLGANKGLNLDYYFLKADRVVAVEANPHLCELMAKNFKNQIEAGKLQIVNAVIVEEELSHLETVDFYISKSNDVLSQIFPPKSPQDFNKVSLRSISVKKLFEDFIDESNSILYCKIDLEGFDYNVMKEMFRNNIFPKTISVECHEAKTVSLLLESRKYLGFKLVDGSSVSNKYKNCMVSTPQGEQISLSFKEHSAGPFGSDIPGDWYSDNAIFEILGISGLGWKDICATQEIVEASENLSRRVILNALTRRLLVTLWREITSESLRTFVFSIREKLRITK